MLYQTMNLFALGSKDGKVYRAAWNNKNWDWSLIDGAAFDQGNPVAAVSGVSPNLFVLGEDGMVRWAFQNGSTWNWATVGGAVFNQGNPIATFGAAGSMNLFVLGQDGVVRWAFQKGSSWSWAAIEGAAFKQGTPIAVGAIGSQDKNAPVYMNLFVLGATDGVVRWAFQNSSGWHWAAIEGAAFNQGNPITVGGTSPFGLDIFVLGEDGVIRWAFQNASGWHWASIGGAGFDQGTPITMAPPSFVFALGNDGAVRQAIYQNSTWNWSAIGGAAFNRGNQVSFSYQQDAFGIAGLNLFVLGQDGVIRWAFQNGSTWNWAVISGGPAFNQGTPITCASSGLSLSGNGGGDIDTNTG